MGWVGALGDVGRVAVVTDSTACLPPEVAQRHGITVVPLQVVIGGVPADESYHGSSGTPGDVAEALRRRVPVTTSRPPPDVLRAAYEALARGGAAAVVSVHLSAQLSGTVEAALLAAGDAPVPVRVVDSGMLGMGLGFAVLSAAAAADAGSPAEQVAAVAQRRAARSRAYLYVDTLEHLRRGGRLRVASALLASALAVKPLLHVVEGRIELLEKVRTASRALGRLEDLAVQAAEPVLAGEVGLADRVAGGGGGRGGGAVAVHHLAAPERAGRLAQRVRDRLPGLPAVPVTEVGAVVGAHTGPGMVGVVVAPR